MRKGRYSKPYNPGKKPSGGIKATLEIGKASFGGGEASMIIAQTRRWIVDVVVGCHFCPFASREIKGESIYYRVEASSEPNTCMESLMQEMARLDEDETISTTLLILPQGFDRFEVYLDLVALAEKLLKKAGYEGIYQLASFHPLYRFSKTTAEDPANYTNRSIHPMLHLLREAQVEKALSHYSRPDKIPADNINFAREKGELYMRMLRESCIGEDGFGK